MAIDHLGRKMVRLLDLAKYIDSLSLYLFLRGG
jgi:hypothetical protein